MSDYQDLIVTSEGGVATVAINRPKVLNAMRAETVEELIRAIDGAGWDKSIGVIVLTGTGKAFAPAATRAPMKANTTAGAPSACRSRRCSRSSGMSRSP
jgi:2-ketocyclohexanecarboxyl-CoA hydrolase